MRTQPRISIVLLLFALYLFPLGRGFAQGLANETQATLRYKTTARLPLSQASSGIDGYLELRQDARLTPELIGLLWGTGDINNDDDPKLAVFKSNPPRNGAIQVVDRAGKILAVKDLERPLAKVRTAQLYGDAKLTYLLTVDYSAGLGSYNGPITSLVEVKNGHLRWLESTEPATGRTGEIRLMESLKTTWWFVDAADGKGKQILRAQCRPDWSSVKNDPDFTTQYARFYFDGPKWLTKVRTVKGLSEFDQGFPELKNFP
jgi:hypothetical protein